MADNYKKIRCVVFRADDPEDVYPIHVGTEGVHGEWLEAKIVPGDPIMLPMPLYEVLRVCTCERTKQIEENGNLKTVQIKVPRFSIAVDMIETDAEANRRVAEYSIKQGQEIDEKDNKIKELQDQISEMKKAAVLNTK